MKRWRRRLWDGFTIMCLVIFRGDNRDLGGDLRQPLDHQQLLIEREKGANLYHRVRRIYGVVSRHHASRLGESPSNRHQRFADLDILRFFKKYREHAGLGRGGRERNSAADFACMAASSTAASATRARGSVRSLRI